MAQSFLAMTFLAMPFWIAKTDIKLDFVCVGVIPFLYFKFKNPAMITISDLCLL